MSELLGYFYTYGIPLAIVFFLMIAVVLAMGAAVSCTRYIVLAYVICVLLIPISTSFGTLSGENTNNFWVKGTKNFFFSFLDFLILGTWLMGIIVSSKWQGKNRLNNYGIPMAKSYIAFGILFAGYIAVAMFDKAPILLQFGGRGVISVFWQGMLVSLMVMTVRNSDELQKLTIIILVCTLGRESWGLFRYLFLGGDPQNYYANFELVAVRITFWDISDSIFACILIGYLSWKILVDGIKTKERLYLAVMGLFLALITPALSSRRTALGALILALISLFFLLPSKKRKVLLILMLVAAPVGLASLIVRSGDRDRTVIEKITIDVKVDKNADPTENRFYELQTAWKTIKEVPLFGVGPPGSFKVTNPKGLYYHKGVYDYVHSGFAHVLLKTGFVGLFIYLSIYVSFISYVIRGWKYILPEHKAIAVGSICAFVAELPNWATGDPIVEIRSMQVAGIIFALPLICISIGKAIFESKNTSTTINL